MGGGGVEKGVHNEYEKKEKEGTGMDGEFRWGEGPKGAGSH